MNKMIRVMAFLAVISFGMLTAITSEFRTPLSLYRGTVHYPLDPVDKEKDSLWTIDGWKSAYYRCADEAYMPKDECSEKSTTNTKPLSALFFGKADFRGEEAFPGGILLTPSGVPALSFAKLSPRFDYNEQGAVFGLHVKRRFEDSYWHFGARASVPFKVIEVEQSRSCGSERLEEDAANVIVRKQENPSFGANLVDVNAYRLDFLSTLLFNGNAMVQYGDGDAANPTKLASKSIVEAAGPLGNGKAPYYALRFDDGSVPSATRLAQDPDNVAQLNADGSGGLDGDRRLFDATGKNYADNLGKDRDAQGKLFMVPRSQGDSLDTNARVIQNAIEFTLNQLDLSGRDSAEQFFKDKGVLFCQSDRVSALGDIDTEFYVGYEKDNWYLDYLIGLRLPTGKKLDCEDIGLLLKQSTGNNRHFEFKVGLEGGWHPTDYDWFALRAYVSYAHAFKRGEFRAPAFKGATIKNVPVGEKLGIDTDVSWGYFNGNVDFNFFHPQNKDLGCTIGYELFAKREDNVSYCQQTAKDCLGQVGTLDEKVLENNTKSLSHKIRGEFFYRIGYAEFFAGSSQVIAGRFVMKESEAHIGVSIYY